MNFIYVQRGWAVMLKSQGAVCHLALGDGDIETIARFAVFPSRKAARAFARDSAAHGIRGGRPVRYRCSLEVDGGR